MRLSKVHAAVLALIIANLIWGAASPIFKWSLESIQPFTLAFLRFFIAALLVLPLTIHNLRIAKQDIVRLMTMAVVGITFHIPVFFIGLKLSSSINAPIISSAAPVFLILASIIFLKEKPKRKVIVGTFISLLGVMIIILQPLLEKGVDGSLVGNLLFVLATITYVFYTIVLKELSQKYSALTLTFWTFAIASVTLLPYMLIEAQPSTVLTHLDIKAITGILFGGFLSSGLAYFLYGYALKNLGASEVGVFTYIDPVIAVIIAIPLLGETVTSAYLLGALLVFLGIFFAEGRIPYHSLHKLR